MLDTGAACSIINYRAFEEIAQFGQPITVVRNKQLTKTYTGEVIPMLGSTTITFSFDSDGLHPVELKFWITEAKTPNLLGIDFCRQLVSKLHFDLPAIELKDSPNTICYGNLCATKPFPYVSKVETIRTDNPICIDAKTTRLHKYSRENNRHFAPGTSFTPHKNAVKTGLTFVNVLCTKSESHLPILIENNRNHQITLNRGIIGHAIIDLQEKERPKFQIKDCVTMVNTILKENPDYNDCFLLHSTVPFEHEGDQQVFLSHGSGETLRASNANLAFCVSADGKMTTKFAKRLCEQKKDFQNFVNQSKPFVGSVLPFWDNEASRFIYGLVAKKRCYEKIKPEDFRSCIENLVGHAQLNNIPAISIPKIEDGLDNIHWKGALDIIRNSFDYGHIKVEIVSQNEPNLQFVNASIRKEEVEEGDIDYYTEQFANGTEELETDFATDAKSCQPPCTEQFVELRAKEDNDALIDYYLQYQPEEIKEYVKKFDFRYTDLEDEELVVLIDMLIDSADVYSQHKFDVGKVRQKFHVTLKANSELKKQRPSKVPLHLKDKLEKLLGQLQEADIIREMGDDDELGSLFVNPIILMPKADYVKLVIDARYLNSITDLTNYSWPLEPIQMIMTRINGKYFTVSDLSCAYHQVPLSDETQKLTSFIIGGKQYTYVRGFYGLCGLPNFFSRLMAIHFEPLIKRKQAITYLDDSLMQAQTKQEMFTLIHEYHQLLRKAGLKAAPEKTNFFIRKVKFLGHVISEQGIQPLAKRVQDLKNLKSPESKRDVMKVLGCLGFYSCYIKNLHVDSQPFYDLIKATTPFKWTKEHEDLFTDIKSRICEDTILAVPSTEYPFHIHVDSSNVGTGCILVQQFPEGKRIVSFNSRVFDKAEQKMSTLHRELCGIVSAFQTYEHYIIGSPFPIYLYCDHKPILYLWGRKGQLSHSFFKYQVIITKFQNLKIIWTKGSNLAFPDILSRNVTLEETKNLQKLHKEIPRDISFYDEFGSKIHYAIEHNDDGHCSSNDFFPILCQKGKDQRLLHLKNDGEEHEVEHYENQQTVMATRQDIADCFKLGKSINQYKNLCLPSYKIQYEPEYSRIDDIETDSSCDEEEVAELHLSSEDHEFYRDKSTAKEKNISQKRERPLLNKNLDVEQFPHVDTKDLLQKLSDYSKTADLDITTLVAEQINDPVLQIVRAWVRNKNKPNTKTPEIHQSKALLSYFNNFNQLFLDKESNLLCYNEPIHGTDKCEMKICVPLSLFLPLFNLAHAHTHSGHPGIFKTFENIRQNFFWPGRYKWIVSLIEDCLQCQTNKSKRHDLQEAPLEQWGELETTPFKTIHIDHKGPIRPSSNLNTHCLVVVDAFSRFLGVYPVRDTGAQTTINALEKWITSYGIPQKIVHDNGSAFINRDFVNWTKEFGITLAPRTAYSPWTNGKVEVQNKHLMRYWRNFTNESGNNWSTLASKFAFAHNTSVNYTTGMTPYEIVFGVKPQIPMTLKLGLIRDKNKQCKSEFCADLQPHTHSENNLRNKSLDRLLRPQLSSELLTRENDFKSIYSSTYKRCREITSKAHEYRNRFKLGRPLAVGQKVLLENHKPDLSKSQKLKQLRVGPFTVTKQITNTTYEIKEDENPENVKVTHRNHLLEYFPKEETLPPLLTNYAPVEQDDNFYKHLIQTQIDKHNSGQPEHKLDFMPLIITPLSGSSNHTSKGSEFSPSTDSGFLSPKTPQFHTPIPSTSSNTAPGERTPQSCKTNPLPPMQTPRLPVAVLPLAFSSNTPLPKRTPVLPSVPPIHTVPPPDQISPKTGKLSNFKKKVTTRFSEKPKNPKNERSTPGSSLRDIERKGYKD